MSCYNACEMCKFGDVSGLANGIYCEKIDDFIDKFKDTSRCEMFEKEAQ